MKSSLTGSLWFQWHNFLNRILTQLGWRQSATGTVSPQNSSFLLKMWQRSWKSLEKWKRKMNWQPVLTCLLLVTSVISSQRTCQSWRNTLQPTLDIQEVDTHLWYTPSTDSPAECCLEVLGITRQKTSVAHLLSAKCWMRPEKIEHLFNFRELQFNPYYGKGCSGVGVKVRWHWEKTWQGTIIVLQYIQHNQ